MTDHDQISRRTAVTAVAATAALLPFAGAATAHAQGAGDQGSFFQHGVASGDPLPDGVLLWTRVTPTASATPGSGRGPATKVSWQVASDKGFASVVARGTLTTSAASDHTVKADVRGLRPATHYYYRFTVDGQHSPVGRTRTAPAADAAAGSIRFGVVSCSNWESGYFSPYRHLAARTELDAVLHVGDYLYEYKSGEYPDFKYVVRPHTPAHELLTLADYRIRHGVHKTDPDAMAMHATHPVIAMWDDHEFADNAWKGGAVNHTPETEGPWSARMAAAKQAYFEWMPVRPSIAGTTYRRLRFGTLADLHLLDLRSFRDAQAKTGSGAVDDPDRTITGRAQLDWLKSGLERSDTAWRLVGTSVMISQVAFGAVPAHLLGPLAEILGIPKEGLAVNTDQWDGYTDDRRELLSHLSDRGIDNTVFLTGDIHMAWANEVPLKAATYPADHAVATEFVVTSVTSDNVDDFLHVAPHTVSLAGVAAIKAANRHVKWLDMDSHGYGVLDIDAERTQMDYFGISDKTDPNATSTLLRSYRTRSGTQQMERAEQPLV
ncbi:alkaline phosphatase D family protein [Streptomyces angustmyceticus]|uniref:Phosphodiesterase/alkaline phosphatase D n=1 Tax=Streptomyces angustmyceticus TaxID=285578 RepID=A0A5J4LRZ0_9ACTN|nr:alkaline phosphatase D family protein [Streptomyces angustmyceticus]UAL69673.1 alkaline phosphatase D family protein [Streptomyces angustmyceticus]GES34420.1 phosphodiesterase/alkaline phosphatase D [Streptomyces angustmyceticus]